MKTKYKIGDAARILGVSPDLLRYYEKKGVVSPEKDENNDYRYYDFWDINLLMDCLWFKNLGFSIEQIADIVRIPSMDALHGVLLTKEEELRSTITRCQLLLRRSEEHRRDLQRIDTLLYRCEIADSPEFICFINRVGDAYPVKRAKESPALPWLRTMPFNHRYFEICADTEPLCTEDSYRWGFCITREYADALGFAAGPDTKTVPPRRSIHTIFKNPCGRGGFTPGLLQYAIDFAAAQALRISGPVCGVLLASVMEDKAFTGYFEAWLPIE